MNSVSLCDGPNGCNCMTHTNGAGFCGKCGANKLGSADEWRPPTFTGGQAPMPRSEIKKKSEMQEIKFKFWSERLRSMSPAVTLNELMTSPALRLFGGGLTDLVALQYTGLKDKNEVEIHNGDIDTHGQFVVFSDGCFWLKQANGWHTQLCEVASTIEVIGNICENPELLRLTQ